VQPTVLLLPYSENDQNRPAISYEFDYLRIKSGRIWHCRLPKKSIDGARYYAYSITGPEPTEDQDWHAFDGDKVLLDPYAEVVFFRRHSHATPRFGKARMSDRPHLEYSWVTSLSLTGVTSESLATSRI
jgi:pullulanase/glycogen debranching enzyme